MNTKHVSKCWKHKHRCCETWSSWNLFPCSGGRDVSAAPGTGLLRPQESEQGTLGGWGDTEQSRTDYGRVWPWGLRKDSIGTNMESYAPRVSWDRERNASLLGQDRNRLRTFTFWAPPGFSQGDLSWLVTSFDFWNVFKERQLQVVAWHTLGFASY